MLPASLVGSVERWLKLMNYYFASMAEFCSEFQQELGPANCCSGARKTRAQYRNASLLVYIRFMQDIYVLTDSSASRREQVGRLMSRAVKLIDTFF